MKSICAVLNGTLPSSSLPGKLLRPFAGTTLLEIALEKLNRMAFFENRCLAVTENQLKHIGSRFPKVQSFESEMRSMKTAVNVPAVTCEDYLKVRSDYIFVLNPGLPFLRIDTVKQAVNYFQETDFPSYISATASRDWIFDDAGNALTNSDPRNVTTNVGRLFYKGSQAFQILQTEFYRRHGCWWTFRQHDPHVIEIPEEEAVDVDSEMDFLYAEFCYARKIRESGLKAGAP